MNAAVHTSARVHRCCDGVLGISAIYLTTPRGHDDALNALAAAGPRRRGRRRGCRCGDGQRDPCRQCPCDLVCTVSPGIADTAQDREAARPSHPRKYGPRYWPDGGGPLACVGLPHDAVLIEWCLATAARRALCVPTTCRRPFLYSRKGLSALKSGPGDRTGTPPCPRQDWHGGSTHRARLDEP